MTTLTLRELKLQFPKVERIIARGESVTVTRRGKPLLEIHPPKAETKPELVHIDWDEVRQHIWGDYEDKESPEQQQAIWDWMRAPRQLW